MLNAARFRALPPPLLLLLLLLLILNRGGGGGGGVGAHQDNKEGFFSSNKNDVYTLPKESNATFLTNLFF